MMPDGHIQREDSPSQRTANSALPPLSKYYYGSGRQEVPSQRSPSNNPLERGLNGHFDIPPHLPPRNLPALPPVQSTSEVQHQGPGDTGQSWQTYFQNLPGFMPSAPPASQFSNAVYNPNTYGLMPSARQSPLHQNLSQTIAAEASPNTSTWGVKYNHGSAHSSNGGLEPPVLPPRPLDMKQSNARQNEGRTEFSPRDQPLQALPTSQYSEILQPVAYNPGRQPSAPQGFQPSLYDTTTDTSPPEPPSIPPRPPKLPPTYEDRVQLNPQASPQQRSNSFLPPTHRYKPDPVQQPPQHQQASSEYTDPISSFPDEFAARGVNWQDEPTYYAQPSQPHLTSATQSDTVIQRLADPQLHKASVSPTGPNDRTHWVPTSSRWDTQTSSVTPPNSEPLRLSRQNNQYDNESDAASNPDPAVAIGQETNENVQTLSDLSAPALQHQVESWHDDHEESQKNNSFYWHSPHSSSDTTYEHPQDNPGTTTPLKAPINSQEQPIPSYDVEREPDDTAAQTTNMYHSTLGLYSASALGFGGPSDWEHFGDYEAEEVDDTELYSRAEGQTTQFNEAEFAELPAESSLFQSAQQNESFVKGEIASALHDTVPLPNDLVHENPLLLAQHIPNHDVSMIEKSQTPSLPLEVHAQPLTRDKPASQSKVLANITQGTETPLRTNIEPMRKTETVEAETGSDLAHNAARSQENLVPNVDPDRQLAEAGYTSDFDGPVCLEKSSAGSDGSFRQTNLAKERQEQNFKAPPGDTVENTDQTQAAIITQHSEPGALADCVEAASSAVISSNQAPLETGVLGVLLSSKSDENRDEQEAPLETSKSGMSISSLVATPSLPTKRNEISDPYANLDPWAKASLNRYVAMLREEAEAETDKDKLNIFEVFASRESRLRAVLYGVDAVPEHVRPIQPKGDNMRRTRTLALQHSSKALPALPVDSIDSPQPPPALPMVQNLQNSKSTSLQEQSSNPSTDESYVMIDLSEEIQFSPGGRPRVSRTSIGDQNCGTRFSNNSTDPEILNVAGLEDAVHDQKPAYTPFKYNDGRSESTDRANKRQSYRPYAALMHGSQDGEVTSDVWQDSRGKDNIDDVPNSKIPASILVDRVPDGTGADGMKPSILESQGREQLDLRRFERADFDPLTSVLPHAATIRPESMLLQDLKNAIETVPDDFGFIHQSVVAWDARAKKQREEHERERHARQVESETQIDALFDDHEIGYGDISELESEFKRSEAAGKADEDRLEYKSFVSEVFDLVWTRLHFEIEQLNPRYDEYTGLMNDTLAGKDMFEGVGDRFALAPTMDALLTLHQKIEVRHQKAFEAVLERDRRLKKTEVSPWYSLGNVSKVKQLEKQFDKAEKNAIIEYCRQRNVRANRLMDVLDQNTLRGVGANQDYMECIHGAIGRIASRRAFASTPNSNEPEVGLDEVMKAKHVTTSLATSSEQIVQTFHVADMLLNAADYEVSVAKARYTNADVSTFKRLNEEKANEDRKIMRDLEHRLALIREGSRRTKDEVVKMLCFLGVRNGHAVMPPTVAVLVDPEHENRIQKVLEAAKKRNTQK